jgi:hypothetical protein
MAVARTVEEVKAIDFSIKDYWSWYDLAILIHGPSVCTEMGVKWNSWAQEKILNHDLTNNWDLEPYQILVLIALQKTKAKYFVYLPESFDRIDSLLHEYSSLTNQKYITDLELREKIVNSSPPNLSFLFKTPSKS